MILRQSASKIEAYLCRYLAWWVRFGETELGIQKLGAQALRASVSNGSGYGPEKQFGSVPEPSKNPTCYCMAGQARMNTHQTMGSAKFGYTCRFQSPVLVIGFFYLWSHSDIPLLIAKFKLWYVVLVF
jgi:hypothetical protein